MADVMLKVKGIAFRCACGCNVFHKQGTVEGRYVCNACGVEYEGSSK